MNKKIDNNDIQYKIVKSEACGHTIEYKMVKSINLKKDEDSPRKSSDKLQNQLVQHAREGKKTGVKLLDNMIADAKDEKRMITPAERGELAHNLRIKKEKQDKEKKQQKLAASEEECKCEDKAEKCECEDKEMKKREKFYIQKIQELRKQQLPLPLQGGSLRDRPIKEIPRVLGSKLKTRAKDVGSRLGERVSNLASKAGNLTPNQIAQGVRNAPSQIAQGAGNLASRVGASGAGQLARQGAARAATALGPAGQLYGAFEGGRAVGDYVVNPLIDKYTTETNKYGEKSNAVERGMGKLSSLLPESIGGISEQQYQQSYGDPSASNAAVEQQAKQNYAQSPAARDRQVAKTKQNAGPNSDMGIDQSGDVVKQAPAAQAPAAQAPTEAAAKPQSFGEAFKAARAGREQQIAAGTYNPKLHDTFKYTDPKSGKEASFHSFTKDDFAQGVGNKYNPELRRQQKAIQSSPATPNTETAPSANPIKPADQGSTKLRPEPLSLEQQQKQFS